MKTRLYYLFITITLFFSFSNVLVGEESFVRRNFEINEIERIEIEDTGNKITEIWSKKAPVETSGTPKTLIQTNEGGFFVTSLIINKEKKKTMMESSAVQPIDTVLTKKNNEGENEWSKIFSYKGKSECYDVKQTEDGGYILTGYTSEQIVSGSAQNLLIAKLDRKGNTEWVKEVGESKRKESRKGTNVLLTESGYLISYDFGPQFGPDFSYIIKADRKGNIEWGKKIDFSLPGWTPFTIIFFMIYKDIDHYLFTGQVGLTSRNMIYIGQIDNTGKVNFADYYLLNKRIIEKANLQGRYIHKTSDDNFIIAGGLGDYNDDGQKVFVMKICSGGEVHWFNLFEQSPIHCFVEGIVEDRDGDFVIYGEERHSMESGEGPNIIFICLNESGKHKYTKIFDLGYRRAIVKKIVKTNDGKLVILSEMHDFDRKRYSFIGKFDIEK